MTIREKIRDNTHNVFRRFCEHGRAAPVRSLLQFVEDEIYIPTGPFEGRKFRAYRQPFMGLFFDLIGQGHPDGGPWNEIAAVGPSQSGKSFGFFVCPILYHLFELRETVVVGVPDMDIARDKWVRDINPVFDRTRYADLLPRRGAGSRGGFDTLMVFGNGASLRFMTGGGDDKTRASFTTRVVVFSEVDGMATSAETSVEADKVKQVEARTRAYGRRRMIYKECTVSVEEGHIWQRYVNGTKSKIALPCFHCGEFVSPERENLSGWVDAVSEMQCEKDAHFCCPACKHAWSDEDRREANLQGVVLHDGQEMREGKIEGELKNTRTLGLRWSAVNNLFVQPGEIAADEWNARKALNQENAERELAQFVWAFPPVNSDIEITEVKPEQVQRRQDNYARGYVPSGYQWISVGVDVGKRLLYWTAIAHRMDGRAHVIDYGRDDVASDELGVDIALPKALEEIKERLQGGWVAENGQIMKPAQVWIDAGWQPQIVYSACRECQEIFRPAFGRGFGQQKNVWYNKPKRTGGVVKYIGDEFHFTWLHVHKVAHVEINSDHWKGKVHDMLSSASLDTAARLTLFQASANEHLSFSKHLAAERREEQHVPTRGRVIVYRRLHRNNHWLDSTYMAMAAGQFIRELKVLNSLPAQERRAHVRKTTSRAKVVRARR